MPTCQKTWRGFAEAKYGRFRKIVTESRAQPETEPQAEDRTRAGFSSRLLSTLDLCHELKVPQTEVCSGLYVHVGGLSLF